VNHSGKTNPTEKYMKINELNNVTNPQPERWQAMAGSARAASP
jgi:hypothetical protein